MSPTAALNAVITSDAPTGGSPSGNNPPVPPLPPSLKSGVAKPPTQGVAGVRPPPRRFLLDRQAVIAEGICFSNGAVALLWHEGPGIGQVTPYDSLDLMLRLHGRTASLLWLDQGLDP